MRLFCRAGLVLALSLITTNLIAQQFKDERRVYLWDVTLSMKGHNGKTPDIYDKVVKALKDDINSISDERTKIVVLPFQTKIIEKWEANATKLGKSEIIKKIEKYSNRDTTYTNISTPFKQIIREYVSPDKRDVVILLTDGVQNEPGYPVGLLIETIKGWCEYASDNDAYAFYVMLTEFAHDENLIRSIENTCRIENIIIKSDEDININFIELRPQKRVIFNIKNDTTSASILTMSCNKNVEMLPDLKISLKCEDNPYVEVDQVVTLNGGTLSFNVKLKQSYESLKHVLPIDCNYPLRVDMKLEEVAEGSRVHLMEENFTLELINKPEKRVNIYVKE